MRNANLNEKKTVAATLPEIASVKIRQQAQDSIQLNRLNLFLNRLNVRESNRAQVISSRMNLSAQNQTEHK